MRRMIAFALGLAFMAAGCSGQSPGTQSGDAGADGMVDRLVFPAEVDSSVGGLVEEPLGEPGCRLRHLHLPGHQVYSVRPDD